ncbi:lysophospholipid acyltransferase family protein [Ornithobacterium rhinotracheale]|uniref:Lysophospholipid acyltransferase family protein n=1 Tax=Ornithobacterium rhinotracheale TaxID=28251 RepID=A0A3R5XUY7_ORNRH|nr:lysophospholipid acyltransferase family protein [Ornithobacterium rhinotracheale]QAR31765.1 lysophospholipid acyltransferase family protein [Ornithobacterium rhinotracheale]
MSLVSVKDIAQVSGLQKFGFVGKPIAFVLHRLLNFKRLNSIYQANKDFKSPEFETHLLRDLAITYEVQDEELARIPKEGPFVIVSNHPLGGLDGIIMLKILSEIRPDFKIIANFLLQKIEPLAPRIFPVNPFETRRDIKNSLLGMKAALKHLHDGHPLGVFPAGEVSYKNDRGEIVDKPWQKPIMKLIKKAGVPIIPMYFNAKNSKRFYSLKKLHPDLQTALLPHELLKTRLKPIQLRIGKPISLKQQEEFETIEKFTHFLTKKTYVLASSYEPKKNITQTIKDSIPTRPKTVKNIIKETPSEDLIEEVKKLRATEALLFSNSRYECYFCDFKSIPKLMREIGRLREITFRQVGEGTNKETDIDRFDRHYNHLILWDTQENKIAGAYRMGLGNEIYKNYGIKGFYISELFHFDPEIQPFFRKAIEMGRAFVVPEYQQKPMPLFLLWRGIIHVALRNPEHKFILGGVSISNQFSQFSKALMIEFMQSHFYDPYVAQYVRPRRAFKPKIKDQDKDFIFDEAKADLNKFDKLIEELEPNALRLPVLIKKYIKQNAKVIAFNVDPKFNDAIDGLMYIRISELPESTIKPVLEELQAEIEEKEKTT